MKPLTVGPRTKQFLVNAIDARIQHLRLLRFANKTSHALPLLKKQITREMRFAKRTLKRVQAL